MGFIFCGCCIYGNGDVISPNTFDSQVFDEYNVCVTEGDFANQHVLHNGCRIRINNRIIFLEVLLPTIAFEIDYLFTDEAGNVVTYQIFIVKKNRIHRLPFDHLIWIYCCHPQVMGNGFNRNPISK